MMGAPAREFSACVYGTDCVDCGERIYYPPPPPPPSPPPGPPPPPSPLPPSPLAPLAALHWTLCFCLTSAQA